MEDGTSESEETKIIKNLIT